MRKREGTLRLHTFGFMHCFIFEKTHKVHPSHSEGLPGVMSFGSRNVCSTGMESSDILVLDDFANGTLIEIKDLVSARFMVNRFSLHE